MHASTSRGTISWDRSVAAVQHVCVHAYCLCANPPISAGNAAPLTNSSACSDIGGRKWVYVASIAVYALLNIGTAMALNLPMLIIFQFLAGAAGSTGLSNVAGTIADLFGDMDGAGQPMALFVMSANYGPSIGSPIGELIASNPNMGLPWIFWIK